MPALTPEQLTQLRIATERLLELPEAAKWDARGHERRTDEAKVKLAVFGLLNAVNKAVGIRALADLVRQAEASADSDGKLPSYAKSVVYAALMRQIPASVLEEHVPHIVEALGRAALRSENAERELLGLEPIESLAKQFEYTGTALLFQDRYPELSRSVETYMTDAVGSHAQAVTGKLVDAANPANPIGIGPLQQQLRGDVSDLTVKRATLISRTETARVYGGTARGTFKENGIARARLVTAGDPCSICEGIASRGFVELDDLEELPIHPACRCDYIPDVEGWLPPGEKVVDPAEDVFRRVDPGWEDPGRQEKAFNSWRAKEGFPDRSAFTAHEQSFLKSYKNNSRMINNACRGNPKDAAYAIEQLDVALAKHQLSENVVLFRGAQPTQEFVVGEVYHEAAYMSTSLNQSTAMGFTGKKKLTQVLELRVPKGTNALELDGLGLSKYTGEWEILVQRNTAWRVVSMEEVEVGPIPIRRIVMEMA